MSIQQNFPSTRPSLNLNFARSQKLDPRITFTRTSSATRVNSDGLIEVVPANSPRFDFDPISGESLGLLIEEQRTNLLTYSEQFDQSAWTKLNCSITANTTAVISPDGLNTSDKIVENTVSNALHYALQSSSSSSGVIYTFSVFLKSAERTNVQVGLLNQNSPFDNIIAYVNLSDGQITSTTFGTITNLSVSTIPYPNGWYRVIIKGVIESSTSIQGVVWLANSSSISSAARTYTGDGTSGVYVWGAQLEAGAFPTSYIPTSGSAVTRPADVVSLRDLGTSDWWDKQVDSFSMVLEWDSPITLDPSIHGPVLGYFNFWSNSTNFENRIGIPLPHTTSTRALTRAFGNNNAIFNNGIIDAGSQEEFKKMAFSWSIPDYSDHTSKSWKIFFNSGDSSAFIAGNSFGTTPPNIQRLGIGCNPTRFDESPGVKTFKKLTFYNSVLTDSQLQTLTK